MDTTTVWQGLARGARYPSLEGDIDVEVAVIGGGITGITLAARLADEGRSVAVLEAVTLGSGTTGHSTGNLYAPPSGGLARIEAKWGREAARQVVQSRLQAVGYVERVIDRHRLDCGFRRCPLHRYATDPATQSAIHQEHTASLNAGLDARLSERVWPAFAGRTLVIDGQAQLHPYAYVRALAASLPAERVRIFEGSPVRDVDDDHHRIATDRGTVSAREIVLATHTPKGLYGVHAEMTVHREYALAATLARGECPDGIFWGHGDFGHSLRNLESDGRRYLIVVGEEHRTGEHEAALALSRLETFARGHFALAEIHYVWSAQNYHSPDHLPYIGRTLGSRVHIATGFETDGLTWGTLAANLIADQIVGVENPWQELFKATRFAPLKAARGVIEENVVAASAFIKDRLAPADEHAFRTVTADHGAIVSIDGERFAAYRAPSGALSLVSPVCTHMGCMVHWNGVEKSWDCPCHGSRFGVDGRVLEGPALAPLPNRGERAG